MTAPLTPSRSAQARIAVAVRRRLARRRAEDLADETTRRVRRAERLDHLWRYATRHSAYYRRHAAASGHVELDALPILTKADLVGRFDELVTVDGLRRADLEGVVRNDGFTAHSDPRRRVGVPGGPRSREATDRFHLAVSSGSSGVPAILAYDGSEWIDLIVNVARARALAGGPSRRARPRSAKVSSPSRWHLSTQVPATLSDPRRPSLHVSASAPLDELAATLTEWAPNVLSSYPSVLRLLADRQHNGTLDLDLDQVFSTGEYLATPTRDAVRSAWGVEVTDQYVATEVGFIAAQCPAHDGYHVLDDHVVVEVVDDQGRPCAPGETGQVLVTALHARTVPLIRYRLGDRATRAEGPCRCGRHGDRLASIEGSERDVLVFQASKSNPAGVVEVHPVAITALVDRLPVGAWVVESDDEAVRLAVSSPSVGFDAASARDRLDAALRAAGVPQRVAVRVEVVDVVAPGAGGKAARFRRVDGRRAEDADRASPASG